jgi:hypothetical protein
MPASCCAPWKKKSSTKSSSSINRSSIFGNSLFCLHGRVATWIVAAVQP